ncbi:MAG: hypothetical protein K2M96_08330, partial [Prevotella sp.]|nr:hypothetical protein [Prevotella sp.]
NMKELILKCILIPALKKLYQVDFDNIKNGVSERNICARLSLHLENQMRKYDNSHKCNLFQGYYADVEYNRMGNGNPKKYENSEHRPQYMVSDLLIQSRGPQNNLLAVETKRKSNYKHIKEDKERLESLVSSPTQDSPANCVHDTVVGAFIRYSPNGIEMDIFENIDGKGKKTKCISLTYNHNELGNIVERCV